MGSSAASKSHPKPVKPTAVRPNGTHGHDSVAVKKAVSVSPSSAPPKKKPSISTPIKAISHNRATPPHSAAASSKAGVKHIDTKPSVDHDRPKRPSAVAKQVTPVKKAQVTKTSAAKKAPTAVTKKSALSHSQTSSWPSPAGVFHQVVAGQSGNFISRAVQRPVEQAGNWAASNIDWAGSTVSGVGKTLSSTVDNTVLGTKNYVVDYANSWLPNNLHRPTASNPLAL